MDMKHLETFVYTVKYKSFSKAAEKIYLSQPTISQHINSLEKELNTQLISRTTREFSITEAGERLYQYATSILDIRDKAIDDITGINENNLHMGVSTAVGVGLLPKIMSGFNEHDKLIYTIESSDSLDIIKKVAERSIDFGLVGTKEDQYGLKYYEFAKDELVYITPNNKYYKELLESSNPIISLIKEPMILRSDESGTKRETKKILKNLGISISDLNVIAQLDDPISIGEWVRLGMGVSIVSKLIAQRLYDKKEVLIHPIKNSGKRKMYLVLSDSKFLSDISKRLIDYILDKNIVV